MGGPGCSLRGGIVDDDMRTEWGYGVGREVIWLLMKTLVCGDQWIGAPWMKMVIRYVGLGQDGVPYLEWHSGIGREEACNIMVSPRSDDALGDVGSFVVGRNILDSDLSSIAKEGF